MSVAWFLDLGRSQMADTQLIIDKIVFDHETRELRLGKKSCRLTPTEARILEALSKKVETEKALHRKLYAGRTKKPGSNIIRVYISYMRSKLDTLEAGLGWHVIKSDYNLGYSLDRSPFLPNTAD